MREKKKGETHSDSFTPLLYFVIASFISSNANLKCL